MKSLSQERSAFAYEKAKSAFKKIGSMKEFSSFVAGLPAMILQNGLGHTLCFLLAKAANQGDNKYKKDDKHWLAFEALAEWLKERGMLSFDINKPADLIEEITKKGVLEVIAIQEEALRFLEWFKVVSKVFVEDK
ncbi:MAG: type III-B CRISPR module-associated protein Cmr5 [Thermodesulforhabdaceae bacterium]